MRHFRNGTALLLALSVPLLSCGGGRGGGGARRESPPAPAHAPAANARPADDPVAPRPSPHDAASKADAPGAQAAAARPVRRPRAKILYAEMDEAERRDFLLRRARLVAIKISGQPYQFTDGAVGYVREYVDIYLGRVNNRVREGWGKDLNHLFAAAQGYAPCISSAFRRRNVSPVIGLYIVAVETEFTNFSFENDAGAAGLFQFIPSTARAYGVSPAERGNLKKMSDAAARYMAHRISEFGGDPMSVALAIAAYNRSPDSVRRDLQEVLSAPGAEKERSFWTLITNSAKLDKYFQRENVKYVPKFFAIAIIGETPWAFGLEMKQALSTYESSSAQCPSR